MTPRDRSPRPGEAGFVLIGVVIFVIALTIIGMSLYSLSSYEAQFLQRSLDGEQAFQSAVGGIERAKFALTSPLPLPSYVLDNVRRSLPLENVTAAVAIQNGDSTGTVDWHGTDVTIRVTAEVNGARRTVEGRFKPSLVNNIYAQAITTSGHITVDAAANADPSSPPTDRSHTIDLTGRIWQGGTPVDTSWTLILRSWLPPILTDPVDPPAVAQFLSGHPSPTAAQFIPGPPPRYILDAGPGHPALAYFGVPVGTAASAFSLWDGTSVGPEIQVTGCAVWLFPRGVRFDYQVQVTGHGPDDCLVIVADASGTCTDDSTAGIWFFGGLQANIPVILVADGRIYVQHLNNYDGYSEAPDITLYARDVCLTGPNRIPVTHPPPAVPPHMSLTHDPTGRLDTYWVPWLAGQGALPNLTSVSGRELTFVPGSWQASVP